MWIGSNFCPFFSFEPARSCHLHSTCGLTCEVSDSKNLKFTVVKPFLAITKDQEKRIEEVWNGNEKKCPEINRRTRFIPLSCDRFERMRPWSCSYAVFQFHGTALQSFLPLSLLGLVYPLQNQKKKKNSYKFHIETLKIKLENQVPGEKTELNACRVLRSLPKNRKQIEQFHLCKPMYM